MLNRTSIKHLNSIIKENQKWKVLDVGCGYRAHPKASVIADVQDLGDVMINQLTDLFSEDKKRVMH